ncbi:thioesterase domain-containing protein [Micromonospora sp. NBC_01392]|uniref:thioesterase II family protein n=1 Tax=Micromonospora sp. NBC_01392 TaxID=2903588 RepID=UPI003252B3D2
MDVTATRRPWLLRKPTADSTYRLFLLPYSGVGASMYARWPARLGPAEVCLVQPPGRENRFREPHYGRYEDYAAALVDDIRPLLDRPFAFFGHCSSALAGFATALHLQRLGLPVPDRLFVSSEVAPHDGPYGRFLEMDDEALGVELAGLIRAMGGRPQPDAIEVGLGVLRADLAANRRYVFPEPVRLATAITVIGWTDDREIRPEQMVGWRAYSRDVRFVTLRGNHHAFLTAPPALRGEIMRDLERTASDADT